MLEAQIASSSLQDVTSSVTARCKQICSPNVKAQSRKLMTCLVDSNFFQATDLANHDWVSLQRSMLRSISTMKWQPIKVHISSSEMKNFERLLTCRVIMNVLDLLASKDQAYSAQWRVCLAWLVFAWAQTSRHRQVAQVHSSKQIVTQTWTQFRHRA